MVNGNFFLCPSAARLLRLLILTILTVPNSWVKIRVNAVKPQATKTARPEQAPALPFPQFSLKEGA